MARKQRIECSDGIYHVINRGNYRSFIFSSEGARVAFEKVVFEACERFSWDLHAYCLLSNHFHLCLGTPMGNLSLGMGWLQSTYAARFNRFRNEKGHLFQGRFKSLTVEPGASVSDVVNYIHLNPMKAGLEPSNAIGSYRWSSLWHFPKRARRPHFLTARWMQEGIREGADTAAGWKRYRKLLELLANQDPQEWASLDKAMTRGWCIGSEEFKKAMAEDFFKQPENLRLEQSDLREVNQLMWTKLLERCLHTLKKTDQDIVKDRFSADWKLAIASKLRRERSVSNAWLAQRLNMGVPRGVSSNCGRYQRDKETSCPWAEKLRRI